MKSERQGSIDVTINPLPKNLKIFMPDFQFNLGTKVYKSLSAGGLFVFVESGNKQQLESIQNWKNILGLGTRSALLYSKDPQLSFEYFSLIYRVSLFKDNF